MNDIIDQEVTHMMHQGVVENMVLEIDFCKPMKLTLQVLITIIAILHIGNRVVIRRMVLC